MGRSPRRSVKHTKGDTRVYNGKNQVYNGRQWNTILHCSQCTYTCYLKADLTKHLLTHTGQRPHKCTFPGCDKSFAQKSNLPTHLLTHTGERPHKCPHCNKAFTQKGALNIHLLTHTGERPQITFLDVTNLSHG